MKNRKILAVDAINKPREFMLSKKLISAGVEIDPEKIADSTTDFKFLAEQALKSGS